MKSFFRNFASIMMEKITIIFIINPIAGTNDKDGIPGMIGRYIDKSKFNYEIVFTKYAGHASDIAKKAIEKGVNVVVAVGGDGTINEVARELVQTSVAFGIIPCGSGNGLARHLFIPIDTKKATEIINNYEVHALDYGIINDMPFFCTCGMGFDAFISLKFAMAGKRGPITYAENVLKEGLKYKPETYEIVDESGTQSYKAFLISCANASQYGNNAYIAPQASMRDGLLDVIIMEPFDILEAPQISIDLFNKTLDKNSKIKTFRTKKLHVHRSKPGVIHYDGDPIMTGADVDISIVDKGINVIVNPNVDKTERQPNAFQTAFSDFFNNLTMIREDISKQSKHLQEINKLLLKKLNK